MHGEEHRGEVGSSDRLESLQRGSAERRRPGDAGIGEHDIELAEFCDHLLQRGVVGGDVGGVGDHREHVRPEFPGGGFQRHLVAAGDEDLRPLSHEHLGGGQPMPALPPVIHAVLLASLTLSLHWLHY